MGFRELLVQESGIPIAGTDCVPPSQSCGTDPELVGQDANPRQMVLELNWIIEHLVGAQTTNWLLVLENIPGWQRNSNGIKIFISQYHFISQRNKTPWSFMVGHKVKAWNIQNEHG